MKNVVFVPVAVLAVYSLLGCGSSSGPRPLSIQLAPSAPTVSVNSSVVIDAQTVPELPKYYGDTTWTVQGYGEHCTEPALDPTIAPPMSGCPNGWLAYEQPGLPAPPPTQVYYYAPAIPGTCTVVFQGQIHNPSSFQKIDYQGNATAVVSVTTP
jgi:predicted small lipoprotein YifL